MDIPLGPSPMPFDGLDRFTLLPKTAALSVPDATEAQALDPKKEEIAKAFETILLTRLMEQMRNSVGKWGIEEDPASDQVQGIFWMHLAQEVGAQGGVGLWKNIYEFVNETSPNSPSGNMDLSL